MPRPTLKATLWAPLVMMGCISPAASGEITGQEWQLIARQGEPVAWTATLALGADGTAYGQAPCNRFFGTSTATLPALALTDLGATRMACPDLAAESDYFQALAAVTMAEIRQGHLFLTGPEGRVLEFVRDRVADETCLSCTDRTATGD